MFRRAFLCLALLIALPACADAADSQANKYQEGVHYDLIKPPQPTEVPDKIEVLELFWYGCPHCYEFEPAVAEWLKKQPDPVNFVRMPAAINPRWEAHAKAYYAAEAMDSLDKVHEPLFRALHAEHRKVYTEDEIVEFVATQGVDGEEFRKAMNSFAVAVKVNRTKVLARRFGIRGVPSLIVNGKYRISSRAATSYRELLDIVDFLVAKESVPAPTQAAQ